MQRFHVQVRRTQRPNALRSNLLSRLRVDYHDCHCCCHFCSEGHHWSDQSGSSSSSSSSSSSAPGRSVQKREVAVPALLAAKRGKAGASSSAGLRVSICGQECTSLSWYLNNSNPSKVTCAQVRERLASDAIELEGGHVRKLVGTAYAVAPPRVPQPLCMAPSGEPRQRLGTDFVDTVIADLKARRCDGYLVKRNS